MSTSTQPGSKQQQAFATIHRLCRLLAGGTETLSLLRAILSAALTLTDSHGGGVLRLMRGERRLRTVAQAGAGWHEGQEVAADSPPWQTVIGAGKPVYAPTAAWAQAALASGSGMILPLLAHGDVLGVLTLHGGKRLQKTDKMMLETLAHLAAHVMHQAERVRDLEQHRAALTTLIDVGQDVSASLEPDEVLKRVVRQATRLMRAKVGSLMLVDADGATLHLRATYGASQTYAERPPFAVDNSLLGEVVRTGVPMAVLDVREHEQYQLMEMARQEGLCSLLSVPLRTSTSTRVTGVLNVYTVERRRFRPEEVEFLSAVAALSATAIEHARLYQAMLDSQERLRQSERLAALGSMLAGLAHEIRNPLHTMQLLVYAIQQDCLPESPLRADVEVLQSEIGRLALLVEQCLDVARPRAPEQKRQKLHEVVEETLLVVSAEARRRHIQLRKHWSRALPAVLVDGAQMKQVFLNVLLNAMQAMDSGGAIDVSLSADDTSLTARIQDQGQGIPEDVQTQLFTPFFTTKPQGTGLGLSISQRIVEGHGGCIRITSRPGEGTAVSIIVPRTSEV